MYLFKRKINRIKALPQSATQPWTEVAPDLSLGVTFFHFFAFTVKSSTTAVQRSYLATSSMFLQ
jgi:hypothetical protein